MIVELIVNDSKSDSKSDSSWHQRLAITQLLHYYYAVILGGKRREKIRIPQLGIALMTQA